MLKLLASQSSTEHTAGYAATSWMNVTTVYVKGGLYSGTQVPATEENVLTESWKAVVLRNVKLLVLLLLVLVFLFWNACQWMGPGICVLINQYIKFLDVIGGDFSFFNFDWQFEDCFSSLLHGTWGWILGEWLLERTVLKHRLIKKWCRK